MNRMLVLLVAVCVAAVASKSKKSKLENRFCPLEYKGNQCRARRNQYKCGAFFVNLHGQEQKLRWIGALPDILVKPRVRNSPVLMKSFGWAKKKSFRVGRKRCSEDMANDKCYDMMESIADVSLDSCQKTLLNPSGRKTVGNVLCEQAGLWAPGQHFQSFVTIGFYHSACGGNWTETGGGGLPLKVKEEMCCKFENGRGQYFKCDGAPYRRTCDEEIFSG